MNEAAPHGRPHNHEGPTARRGCRSVRSPNQTHTPRRMNPKHKTQISRSIVSRVKRSLPNNKKPLTGHQTGCRA